MKQNLFIALILLFFKNTCDGQNQNLIQFFQNLNNQSNTSPEEYFFRADSIMSILHGNDTSESGPKAQYERYKSFFLSRCKPQFSNESISDAYVEALINSRSNG